MKVHSVVLLETFDIPGRGPVWVVEEPNYGDFNIGDLVSCGGAIHTIRGVERMGKQKRVGLLVRFQHSPQRGDLWRHFKGAVYSIVEVGIWAGDGVLYEQDTPVLYNGTVIVSYRRIGPRKDPELKTYHRTLEDFLADVSKRRDNTTKQTHRFERVECDR